MLSPCKIFACLPTKRSNFLDYNLYPGASLFLLYLLKMRKMYLIDRRSNTNKVNNAAHIFSLWRQRSLKPFKSDFTEKIIVMTTICCIWDIIWKHLLFSSQHQICQRNQFPSQIFYYCNSSFNFWKKLFCLGYDSGNS